MDQQLLNTKIHYLDIFLQNVLKFSVNFVWTDKFGKYENNLIAVPF